jgi:hypothetical protein
MCFGGGSSQPSSPSAGSGRGAAPSADIAGTPATPGTVQQQITDQNTQNQANIKAGNANIDSAFAKFNDPYYAGYTKSYEDYYNPQVDNQYKDAEGTLEAGLARQGLDRSSIAATQIGRLFSDYGDQKATIANNAVDGANQLRGKVASEKSNLYGLNAASGDPAMASTQALAASTALVAPQTYSPLGNLFANFVAPYTAYSQAYNNSAGKPYVSPNTGVS